MKLLIVPAALALAATASHAITCGELQAQIDAKVRAGGISRFTLSTVDASAAAPGKVVGTCEMGSKKIVYQAAEGSPTTAGAAAVSAPASRSRKDAGWTECRDGTVITSGSCKN